MLTFTRRTQSEYDAGSDTATLVETTITGEGTQMPGDPQRYAALGLDLQNMPTLLVSPTTYPLRAFTDEFVKPGDTVPWNGFTWTVKDVNPIAPDGFVVLAYVVIAR
jgi:hypothetical protein